MKLATTGDAEDTAERMVRMGPAVSTVACVVESFSRSRIIRP
jgi:hypothetical protein